MDISTLVNAVITAYEDAANLVKRIKQKREDLPEEPTTDLLNSLMLGPVIVRGHFDHDLKRFGEPYACGDIQSREQMKDVLISLQMALITTLTRVWMDEADLDYNTLQTASDDSRVNAGVCLGQLSQRLSDAMKAASMRGRDSMPYRDGNLLMPMAPSLQYSSSRSTQSSGYSRGMTVTPATTMDQFGRMSLETNPVRLLHHDRKTSATSDDARPPYPRRDTASTQASLPVQLFPQDQRSIEESIASRRPSSHTLAPEDSVLLSPVMSEKSPVTPQQPFHSNEDPDRASYVSSPGRDAQRQPASDMSRTSSGQRSNPYGPDDIRGPVVRSDGNEVKYSSIYDTRRVEPKPPAESRYYRGVNFGSNNADYSDLEHVNYLRDHARLPVDLTHNQISARAAPPTITRKPMAPSFPPPDPPYPDGRSQSMPQESQQMPREYFQRPSVSGPIPVESKHFPGTAIPSPPAGSIISQTSSYTPGPLNLPTDKNMLGFCKGAFRLQVGLEKKAFTVCRRPLGMNNMIPYWRCKECNFEGPVVMNAMAGGKKNKTEMTFDPRVRTSEGGVRYKWAFLAKCHVTTKGLIEGVRDGSFGVFGCLFCAAEASSRQWDQSGNTVGGGGKTMGSSGTPIFGNVQSFMEHMQLHRQEDMWPGIEMRGRSKCIVGRLAEHGEQWDINLPPL